MLSILFSIKRITIFN